MTDSGATSAAYFDTLAPTYDADFTHTRLGRALRQRVWDRLDHLFPPGASVLELACGTGEDAHHLAGRGVHVLATDQSAQMLAAAREKTNGQGVTLARFDLTQPPPPEVRAPAPFDGVLSNFGGLNVLPPSALSALATQLAPLLRPQAPIVLVLMGRYCAWEIAWHLAHLQPRQAFRRLSAAGAPATLPSPPDPTMSFRTAPSLRGEESPSPSAQVETLDASGPLQIYYPSIRQLRRAFAPAFRLVRAWPLGLFLPPTALEPLTRKAWFPFKLFAALDRLPWPPLADHTVYEFTANP